MKIFVFLSFVLLLQLNFSSIKASMTEKQMKTTAKLMRNSCQPKHKVTDAQIDDMHKGVWNEESSIKCYMQCVLVALKVMKKNGLPDWDSAYQQMDQLPEARVVATKASMDKCREQEKPGDGEKCDLSWRMARCIYNDNPANYFLP